MKRELEVDASVPPEPDIHILSYEELVARTSEAAGNVLLRTVAGPTSDTPGVRAELGHVPTEEDDSLGDLTTIEARELLLSKTPDLAATLRPKNQDDEEPLQDIAHLFIASLADGLDIRHARTGHYQSAFQLTDTLSGIGHVDKTLVTRRATKAETVARACMDLSARTSPGTNAAHRFWERYGYHLAKRHNLPHIYDAVTGYTRTLKDLEERARIRQGQFIFQPRTETIAREADTSELEPSPEEPTERLVDPDTMKNIVAIVEAMNLPIPDHLKSGYPNLTWYRFRRSAIAPILGLTGAELRNVVDTLNEQEDRTLTRDIGAPGREWYSAASLKDTNGLVQEHSDHGEDVVKLQRTLLDSWGELQLSRKALALPIVELVLAHGQYRFSDGFSRRDIAANGFGVEKGLGGGTAGVEVSGKMISAATLNLVEEINEVLSREDAVMTEPVLSRSGKITRWLYRVDLLTDIEMEVIANHFELSEEQRTYAQSLYSGPEIPVLPNQEEMTKLLHDFAHFSHSRLLLGERGFLGGSKDGQDPVRDYLKTIGKVAVLEREEETMLARVIEIGRKATVLLTMEADELTREREKELEQHINRGFLARQYFIEANLRLSVSIAKRYSRNNEHEFLDFIQEGNKGVEHAVDKFDWRKGFKFSTYATWWIQQAIDRWRDADSAIRVPVDKMQAYRQAMEDVGGDASRLPEDLLAVHLVTTTGSLDAPADPRKGTENDSTIGDITADISVPEHEQYVVSQGGLREIADAVAMLDPKDRRVVELHFMITDYPWAKSDIRAHTGLPSYEAVGRAVGITGERVRQIIIRSMPKVAKELERKAAE